MADFPAEESAQERHHHSVLPGRVLAERFRIVDEIGAGGMGKIYLAEHMLMRKQVAIKLLHRKMSVLPEVVARFEREAIAAGKVDHPNVAKAYDCGRMQDGTFFIVMEYIEGRSLADELGDDGSKIEVVRALQLTGQIAEALGAAHAEGIVHRDLKPDNVMLVTRGEQAEQVKVLDFGIAKLETADFGEGSGASITRLGSVFGTPEYMAPEQAAGQAVDHRVDIYALGVIVYRMLIGNTPFCGDDVSATLMQQITQPCPELPMELPESVRVLIRKLLEKNPQDRPSQASEVVDLVLESLKSLGAMPVSSKTRMELSSVSEITKLTDRQKLLDLEKAAQAKGSVQVGPWRLPIWIPALAVLAILLSVAGLAWKVHEKELAQEEAKRLEILRAAEAAEALAVEEKKQNSDAEIDSEIEELLVDVGAGDKSALEKLEGRADSERSVREWLVLGRARAQRNQFSEALDAYAKALESDTSVATDASIKRFLYIVAAKAETGTRAVELAAKHLGSDGADLLYWAWVDMTKQRTPATQLAEELLHRKDIRDVVSPGLEVALDLREAQSCEDFRKLLPRVSLNGDVRSLRLLKRLEKEHADCKFDPHLIQGAINACTERPAPRY